MKAGIDYIGVQVSFLCHDGKGNWLMHQRSQNCKDEQGAWGFGAGAVDFGEDLHEALRRELHEEYDCTNIIINETFPPITVIREAAGQPTHWIEHHYIVQVDPDEVKNNEPTKIDDMEWFRFGQFPSPLHSTVPLLFRDFRELFLKYSK